MQLILNGIECLKNAKMGNSLLMDNLKPYFAVLEMCRCVCFLILWAVLASPPKTAHTRPRFAGARASVQGTKR